MVKKLIILFKLGRKVACSDILNIVSKFKEPPLSIKILFYDDRKKNFNNYTFKFSLFFA